MAQSHRAAQRMIDAVFAARDAIAETVSKVDLPRLAIVGRGRAGKDEAANWLATHTPLVHPGSTSIYLLPYVVAEKHGVPVEEVKAGLHDVLASLEYQTRHANRMYWFDLGNRRRGDNPGFLVDDAMVDGHLLVGVRDPREIAYARRERKVDAVVWVANCRVPHDPTVEFDQDIADFVVENHGDLASYHARIAALCRLARIPMYTEGRPN